ncbi:MAG: FG-GAP repeat protein [Clostridia bacterium]|nr:FG-GAP repeat protein [Clostridia bacterium]
MKIKQMIAASLLAAAVLTLPACKDKTPKLPDDPTPSIVVNNNEASSAVPAEFLMPMRKLLSEWGIRKGSMSDPLIGARILMYEKTKDEVGYAVLDIDGDGVEDMIVAPMDDFKTNGMVYDILTIKDGQAWHLANSLQATYHFMADGSFILRTPTESGSFTFKRVTLNGADRPTEVEITKEESAKYYISTVELTPFSALEN